MVQNSMITPDSDTSKLLGGWHLFNLTPVEISGIMVAQYPVIYNTSIIMEMVFSVALNLDVVSTLYDPFKRNENLKKILLYMRGTIFMVILMPFFSVGHMV